MPARIGIGTGNRPDRNLGNDFHRFPVLVARDEAPAEMSTNWWPFCRPPVHHRSSVYARHRDEAEQSPQNEDFATGGKVP